MARQERADRTRESLIHAAAVEFERHGYALAKVVDISTRAGVSTGALHFHFDDKAALAETVESEAAARLRRAARRVPRHEGNALQRLVRTSEAIAGRLREDVVTRAGLRINCMSAGEATLNLREEWLRCVARFLDEAADERLLADHGLRGETAEAVVGVTSGLAVLSWRNLDWLADGTLAGVWEALLPCIATPAALRDARPGGSGGGGG